MYNANTQHGRTDVCEYFSVNSVHTKGACTHNAKNRKGAKLDDKC